MLTMIVSVTSNALITVASSEDEAMMLSLNGFHLMSVIGLRCPETRGAFTSARPVCKHTFMLTTVYAECIYVLTEYLKYLNI